MKAITMSRNKREGRFIPGFGPPRRTGPGLGIVFFDGKIIGQFHRIIFNGPIAPASSIGDIERTIGGAP